MAEAIIDGGGSGNTWNINGSGAGEVTVINQERFLTSGNVFVTSGNMFVASGNMFVTSGNVTVTNVDRFITSGNVFIPSGNVTVTNLDRFVTSGNVFIPSGNISITDGDVFVASGNIFQQSGIQPFGFANNEIIRLDSGSPAVDFVFASLTDSVLVDNLGSTGIYFAFDTTAGTGSTSGFIEAFGARTFDLQVGSVSVLGSGAGSPAVQCISLR